jgi:hexulose-6-phosphate isomerase
MLAVMQGRLSPPTDGRIQCFPRYTWAEEVRAARGVGLDAIEWIVDHHGEGANPIETDEGLNELLTLARTHDVVIESICADWFMEDRLAAADDEERARAQDYLDWLIERGARLGIRRIVLPFVDAAALATLDDLERGVEAIERALETARPADIELHLETSFDPEGFAAFLDRIPDPFVKVNYDIGNSSGLGYDPHEELVAYGERLGSVHIKDRVRNGTTVALGTGDADLDGVFEELKRLSYRGPFVLQVARGQAGDELNYIAALVADVRARIASL